MWDNRTSRIFQTKLLRWYHAHRRSLPWRNNVSPYRVWISEVMLQQTQIKTMLPYYNRFLERFPDIDSLARSSEADVLRFWSGLGYYSRARNLHRAAKQILEVHESFPRDFNSFLALPGIGRYTAGAICSIAFNQQYPVVDGNIRRVLTRLNGIRERVSERYFWDLMSVLVPKQNAADFNQAMMELGALVCIPLQPKCSGCPVRILCTAKRLGIETEIPAVRKKTQYSPVTVIVLVLEQQCRILLSNTGKRNLIPGDWGLPWRFASERDSAGIVASGFCEEILGCTFPLETCAPVRHSITNHQITCWGYYGKLESAKLRLGSANGYRWVRRSSINKFLTSSLFLKILAKCNVL